MLLTTISPSNNLACGPVRMIVMNGKPGMTVNHWELGSLIKVETDIS